MYNVKYSKVPSQEGAAARLRSRFAVKHGTSEEQASIGGLYRVHNSILLPLPYEYKMKEVPTIALPRGDTKMVF